jgi:hypothetical protein
MTESYDPSRELEAMAAVAAAAKGLPVEAIRRVLDWAGQTLLGEVRPAVRGLTTTREPVSSDEKPSASSLPEFFSSANAASGPERALVVAYWYQVFEGQEDFDGKTINDALKDLGHGLPNVTTTMSLLIGQKPQPVIQTRKQGKAQQARKLYRLTAEGQRRVEEMVRRAPQ